MTDQWIAPEYIAARRSLLDALEILREQRAGLVLVGAQAIYLHAPAEQARQPTYTTDSDLALDPILLTAAPDMGALLIRAGYREHSSPGTFVAPNGVPIDLMVPVGSLPRSTRRTAPLPGQSRSTARRTAGLELALVDATEHAVSALDVTDDRTVRIRVAGPAALAVAKLIKLEERLKTGRRDRVLSKDAGDFLRLLRYCDAEGIGRRLGHLAVDETPGRVISIATAFLQAQLDERGSALASLAVDDAADFESARQVEAAVRILGSRLLAAYRGNAVG